MTTKAEVTEYVNALFVEGEETPAGVYFYQEDNATRAGELQEWMSPEIAKILEKLLGDVVMIQHIAQNGSNK